MCDGDLQELLGPIMFESGHLLSYPVDLYSTAKVPRRAHTTGDDGRILLNYWTRQ